MWRIYYIHIYIYAYAIITRIYIELDDSIGDIKSTILDTQKTIILEVEEYILDIESDLHEMNYILATLDVISSLGQVASENHFVRPVCSYVYFLCMITWLDGYALKFESYIMLDY